jgi:hypothetical protein
MRIWCIKIGIVLVLHCTCNLNLIVHISWPCILFTQRRQIVIKFDGLSYIALIVYYISLFLFLPSFFFGLIFQKGGGSCNPRNPPLDPPMQTQFYNTCMHFVIFSCLFFSFSGWHVFDFQMTQNKYMYGLRAEKKNNIVQ